MSFLDKSLGHVHLLEKSMNASWLRGETIANNIANVNTPKFKRSKVKFETLLKDEMNHSTFKGSTTHSKHMPIGNKGIDQIKPVIQKDVHTKSRKDGNNVNIDVEMANLAKNTIRYYTLQETLSSDLRKLKYAVKDGR